MLTKGLNCCFILVSKRAGLKRKLAKEQGQILHSLLLLGQGRGLVGIRGSPV